MDVKVGIADLKAHLSAHLRKVKKGQTLVVVEHAQPVAKLVPMNVDNDLIIRQATKPFNLATLPQRPKSKITSLELLLEERKERF